MRNFLSSFLLFAIFLVPVSGNANAHIYSAAKAFVWTNCGEIAHPPFENTHEKKNLRCGFTGGQTADDHCPRIACDLGVFLPMLMTNILLMKLPVQFQLASHSGLDDVQAMPLHKPPRSLS